jgi:hypothetical protein
MSTTQIDFLVGATVALLYMLYVLVRVLSMRDTSWLLKLLISVPVLIVPVGGALLVHVSLCVSSPEPRDGRFLGVLGLAGALVALLAYASTFARFAVHDVYTFCFILLGFAAFLVLAPFFLGVWSVPGKDWMVGLLSMFPKWAIVLAAVTVVNTVVHIGVYYEFAEYGVPRERAGKYYLETDDRLTREITEEEYYAFGGHFVRGTSSILLAFFLVPALFYLLRRPGAPGEVAGKPTAADASPRAPDAL